MQTVYFDYNATTPLDPAVRTAMEPFLSSTWGNPSSVHRLGRDARAALDLFRYRMSTLWCCKPSEVVFTGGGTESNNLAILGTARLLRNKGSHLVASPIEHHAVLHAIQYLERHEGFSVSWLPVDSFGRVTPDSVDAALRPDTIIVSVMAANNEIGTLQPVAEIGKLCRSKGVIFHTDAVQAFGKCGFQTIHQFEADLVSVCAHKFHGPKGAGALYVRSPLQPHAVQLGGAQENERRGGTENLCAIAGLTEAFERFALAPVFSPNLLQPLTERIAEGLSRVTGVIRRGHSTNRLSNTVAFTVEGCESMTLLANLDLEGICASSGAACAAGSLEPSHVLRAIGVGPALANSLVRFSLGRENSGDEVDYLTEVFPKVIRRIRES